jgi:hypothetical protein
MAEGAAFDALSHDEQRCITDTIADRSAHVSVSVSAKALPGNAGPAKCCKASWWDRTRCAVSGVAVTLPTRDHWGSAAMPVMTLGTDRVPR